jgi:hypothetical protein
LQRFVHALKKRPLESFTSRKCAPRAAVSESTFPVKFIAFRPEVQVRVER